VDAQAVSVVIPVHDGERLLADAIASALGQGHAPLEVIVVDDASTDGSAGLARSFGPPVRVITSPARGVSAARNEGVKEARGELIAFLDADDLMKPDRLERQVAALAAEPGADFVLGREEVATLGGEELPEFLTDTLAPVAEGREPYPSMTMLVRREAFERVGGFDPGLRLSEDADFVLRAFEAGLKPALVDAPVIVRRFHGANASYDTAGARRAKFEVLRRRAARHRDARGHGPG
jgi:glycosyltransferase involved in cell wall biosynthesis